MDQEAFELSPVCDQHQATPLDIRVVKLLVFLFEVEAMFDPPPPPVRTLRNNSGEGARRQGMAHGRGTGSPRMGPWTEFIVVG